ncbi:MAG: hypothetical protein QM765_49680 [Myxococcales bacterium]
MPEGRQRAEPAITPLTPQAVDRIAGLLAEADHVLIGAGAGMSIDGASSSPATPTISSSGKASTLGGSGPARAATAGCSAWARAAPSRPGPRGRSIDLTTEELTDPALVPRCPRCGGEAMLNVRGGDWFLETPYEPQGERFVAWAREASKGRLLVLDVGSGFNTSTVVRWFVESLALGHPEATFVRVNAAHPEVSRELGLRGLGIASAGAPLWAALAARRP